MPDALFDLDAALKRLIPKAIAALRKLARTGTVEERRAAIETLRGYGLLDENERRVLEPLLVTIPHKRWVRK
jgi:muconolactone delta-isomerase